MKGADLARYSIAVILLSIPLFIQLGDQTIRLWDESRLVMNAWEMFNNREYFVLYFDGSPDMWNTKPPLVIWLQTACIHLFGFTEFSVRFPSALAALLTCLALIVFADKQLKDIRIGYMAAVILVTMREFNGNHVSRTADFDAVLIFMLTLSAMSFFAYAENRRQGYAIAGTIFTGLAILAKGVAGLFFIPGIAVFLLVVGALIPLLKNPRFWLGLLLVIGMVAIVYALREINSPGYLQAVYENEIGGRYFQVNEGHSGNLFYYLKPVFNNFWMFFIPLGFLPVFSGQQSSTKRFIVLSVLIAGIFILAISVSRTKLPWYAAPAYPLLALMLAIGFRMFFKWLSDVKQVPVIACQLFFTALVIYGLTVSLYPIQKMMSEGEGRYEALGGSYQMSEYIAESIESGSDLSGYCFLLHGYQPHVAFYLVQLDRAGMEPRYCEIANVQPGDKVMYWEDEIESKLRRSVQFKEIERSGQVRKAEIISIEGS